MPLLSPCARRSPDCFEQSGKWDRKTQTVQVIEAGERAMQVRFLMSASGLEHALGLEVCRA